MANIPKLLGMNIKQRRKDLGMTQAELSKKCDFYDSSTISKIERGLVDIPATTILKISNALRVTPSQLLGDEPLPVVHEFFDEITDERGETKAEPYFMDELMRLAKMYQDGILTKKEFAQAKQKLLK